MTSIEKMNKGVEIVIEAMCETFQDAIKQFGKALSDFVESLKPALKKKMSKKKFCKLLQAHGIQRNEINRLVHNNKEPYTYERLYYLIGGNK